MLNRPRESGPRFHREAWLAAALDVLAEEGQAKLRIDKLAGDLGVTKGSFYHHFDGATISYSSFWTTGRGLIRTGSSRRSAPCGFPRGSACWK